MFIGRYEEWGLCFNYLYDNKILLMPCTKVYHLKTKKEKIVSHLKALLKLVIWQAWKCSDFLMLKFLKYCY